MKFSSQPPTIFFLNKFIQLQRNFLRHDHSIQGCGNLARYFHPKNILFRYLFPGSVSVPLLERDSGHGCIPTSETGDGGTERAATIGCFIQGFGIKGRSKNLHQGKRL